MTSFDSRERRESFKPQSRWTRGWRGVIIVPLLWAAGTVAAQSVKASAPGAAQSAPASVLDAAPLASEPPAAYSAIRPRPAPYRSGPMLERAVPTNKWYSSLVYERWSDVLHAHPLTFRAVPAGLEVGLPRRQLVRVSGKQDEIQYPHVPALTVGPADFQPEDARLHDAGDWNILIRMAAGGRFLDARVMHGGVHAQFVSSTGRVRIAVGGDEAVRITRIDPSAAAPGAANSPERFSLQAAGVRWLILAPSGSSLTAAGGRDLSLLLPDGRGYFAVAPVPDDQPATLDTLSRHAFAFVERTRVEWRYDETTSKVHSRYRFDTRAMEGTESRPLVALYPHLADQRVGSQKPEPFGFRSVRGAMPVIAAESFDTVIDWRGILPMWPLSGAADQVERIRGLLVGDMRRAPGIFGRMMGPGTYWTGKALAALAHLMSSAELAGDQDSAAQLEGLIRRRFAQWFSAQGQVAFVRDREIGAVLGYPEEYGSVAAMNDHHFHYGYWIMAAALVARRDPSWRSAPNGPMIEALIADIATADRDRRDLPFLRNFDVYAGHSWAGGDGIYFGQGNNQESSSEAINAWAALILWGEETGNKALRDLGIYLYAHEASAIMDYWLDVRGRILAPEFGKPLASMVFGGKYAYSTWWTEEPRQIQGINLLPITPASTYLSISPEYSQRFLDGLTRARSQYDRSGQSDGTPSDIWQDVIAGFVALNDPEAGFKAWNPRGSVELGETRTRTFHWLSTLRGLGRPERTVSADTSLYTVFQRPDGARTYVTYLPAGAQARPVRFSDGTVLQAQPGRLVQVTRP